METSSKRFFWAVRFDGGNRTCTTGTPNTLTGRYNIACGLYVFATTADRKKWLNRENLCEPCGCGGGERLAIRRSDIRRYRRGETMEEMANEMKMAILEMGAAE